MNVWSTFRGRPFSRTVTSVDREGAIVNRILLTSAFVATLASSIAFAQDQKLPQDGSLNAGSASESSKSEDQGSLKSFVDSENVDKFIDSLGSVSRDTAIPRRDALRGLKTTLDVRIPMIDRDCDIAVSHQVMKLGYAFYANFAGADLELRRTAEALSRKTDKEFTAVSPKCKAALRGFAFSVLKIYLGSSWAPDEPQKSPNLPGTMRPADESTKTDGGQ